MNKTRIFVVEDDVIYQQMLAFILEMDPDHEVNVFSTGQECLEHLTARPTIVSLDFTLPDMNGGEVLRRIKKFDPDIEVIILSGQQDIPTAIKLVKEGAFDYITKDSETKDRLLNTIRHIKHQQRLAGELALLREELATQFNFSTLVLGSSPAMCRVGALAEKAAGSDINVTIIGKPGTGKEMIAKAIHYNSSRRGAPLLTIELANFSEEDLEQELFGCEKSTVNAGRSREQGKIEQAFGGSLLLKQIHLLPWEVQRKLLRAMESGCYARVGGEEREPFDVRIFVLGDDDLKPLVANGQFREDLYYRLQGLPVFLPPLRQRGNDVILLAEHFLSKHLQAGDQKLQLSREAKKKLLYYDYPGNARELKAVIDLAAILCEDGVIREDDIQFHNLKRDLGFLDQEMSMEAYKRKIMDHFLEKYGHDVQVVAEKLKIGKSTIYRMLKEA